MLFIGDLHVTRKRIDALLERVDLLVAQYPDDDTLIFVGDYVYHFAYDRVALGKLFAHRVDLVRAGKELIILAGNHDWIHNQFVYSEAQLAFELLETPTDAGSIRFVTQPELCSIQGTPCLLFPYTTQFDIDVSHLAYQELTDSSHTKERLSGKANSVLHTMIDDWKQTTTSADKLLIVHHWYIAGKAFPGQFARFGYQSPALSNHRLEDDQLMMLSGHLHQPFVYQNYCCIGSRWSSSPLEVNQQKYGFRYDPLTQALTAHRVSINPYLQVDQNTILEDGLDVLLTQTAEKSFTYLQGGGWEVDEGDELGTTDLAATTMTLVSEDASLTLEQVSDDYKQAVGTIRIKHTAETLDTLISQLQDASASLDTSFSDWKNLLTSFLKARFGENMKPYEEDLVKLGIL